VRLRFALPAQIGEAAPMKDTTACQDCPLRKLDRFRPFTESELSFVDRLKSGELAVGPGATVLEQGTSSTHVYTVLSGAGYRIKTLDDGRQQILNFVMPGDLIGLQAALFDAMDHEVQALTDMRLCVFQRTDLYALFREQPGLGYNVVWHAAREERMLDEHLVSVGRRTAKERIAHTLVFLHERAAQLGLLDADGTMDLRIRQRHLADALGLSVVHTNKTLKKLTAEGLVAWQGSRLRLLDEEGLRTIARYDAPTEARQPLI